MEIFTLEAVQELFSKEPAFQEKFIEYYKEVNEPRFHIKEVGISSKSITDWTKAGLLNDEFQKGRWREFSLIEAIWVKFIEELRFYGMTLENIKELKEIFFPKRGKEINELLSIIATAEAPDYVKDTQKQIKEALEMDQEGLETALAAINFSVFGSIVIIGLILKLNIAFYIDKEGGYFLNLGKPINNIHAQRMEAVFQDMFCKSFAIINIRSLLGKFFDNDKLKVNSDFYFSIMDKDELEVMTAIRSGNYKQIIIKLEDGSITQLRLGKKKDDDLIRKISRILKKGDYQEIHLNVRDGIPVKLDVTDIVKIKK